MEREDEKDALKTRRQREVERLRELFEKRPESDEGFYFQGVLLSDAIQQCVEAFALIAPFNPENLKAACYKLTIGDEYAIGGEIHPLSNEAGKNEITIRPFEVAVIKTHETINMPRFLIGRWNIQVSRAYKGLIWVGGPQVDAGYVGHLFCPIYNLSDQDVHLYKGEAIAVIDFVGTTKFHPGRSKAYNFPAERVLFEEYEPNKLVSGLVSQAKKRLDQVETDLRNKGEKIDNQFNVLQQRVDGFISLTFGMAAILFAAISVSTIGRQSPPWHYISIFLVNGTAIFLAGWAWVKSKSEGGLSGRSAQVIILIALAVAFILQFYWARGQRKQIEDLVKEVHELKKTRSSPTSPPPKTAETPADTRTTGSKESSPNKLKP